MKVRNVKLFSLFVLFFALACQRVLMKTCNTENRCHRTGKYTVCRRVRASFSPEILQAVAVKELMKLMFPIDRLYQRKLIYERPGSFPLSYCLGL